MGQRGTRFPANSCGFPVAPGRASQTQPAKRGESRRALEHHEQQSPPPPIEAMRISVRGDKSEVMRCRKKVASVRRKMHLSLIFLEFLSEMDLEVLGLPSKISAERAVSQF